MNLSENYLLIFYLTYLNIVIFEHKVNIFNSKYTFCLLWTLPPGTASALGTRFPQLRH